MYPFADHAGASAGAFYPEQVYTCASTEANWFDSWQGLPTSKHDLTQGGNAYNLTSYATETSVQRRPSSSYSGLSTPGLSWRDSPLSCVDESPVSSAEAINFLAASGSRTQSLTSSAKNAIPDDSTALYAVQDEAQARQHAAYELAPDSSMVVAAPHDFSAWQAGLPSLGTAPQEGQDFNSTAPAAQSMSSMHTSSPIPPSVPELQHPKPVRAWLPSWQTATEFNVNEFVASSSHINNPQPPAPEPCHAAPTAVSSQTGPTGYAQRAAAAVSEDIEMAVGWEMEDQGSSAPSQQGRFPEGYSWSHLPLPYASTMAASQWAARPLPQILPPNALLYQPIPASVMSGLWTDADPRAYAYPRF